MGSVCPWPLVCPAPDDFVKVLHVIPSVAPRYGGPSRAVTDMCRASLGVGIETLIATTDADGDGRLGVELNRAISYQGVPTIFFRRQWSEAFKYSRHLARWLDARVREFDAVHIHAVFSHACLAAADSCRRHRVPYIVRPLGTLDPWSLRQKRARKMLFWRLGVSRMLKGAAAIHYTALPERQLAEQSLGLKRGVVIPLGVELDSSDDGERVKGSSINESLQGQPFVLVMSRLHQKKGLELLLHAFAPLVKKREFAGWRLALAGDGDPGYVESLRRLVRELDCEGDVIFTGWLEGAQKKALLQGAALLALPSYQENFGLCVIEALSYGVPVLVSSHVNLAPEIEAAGAGWVTELESSALESKLAETFRDADERRRRGANGRELVSRRFTWNAIAADLAALYDSVV